MNEQQKKILLIAQLRAFPEQLAELIVDLTAEQLVATPLAGEWSVAQNVHHVADSHMHSYLRCKLMMSGNCPILQPYDQNQWAEFIDAKEADLTDSLQLLNALHDRWATFWTNLPEEGWGRTGYHLDNGVVRLEDQLSFYVKHGEAHLDQIQRTMAAL